MDLKGEKMSNSDIKKLTVFGYISVLWACFSGEVYANSAIDLRKHILSKFKQNELASPYIKKSVPKDKRVKVAVKDGVAYILGKVKTYLEVNRLVELAMSVPGIIEVDISNLAVLVDEDPSLTEHLMAKAIGRINALMLEGKLDIDSDIIVDGKDDMLVLSGYVLNEADKQTLLKNLQSLKGVQEVKHDLLKIFEE